tara:strand:- start:230 stop:466 length:237 start_codon:yes stop_codon:yes gene_type:complete
LAATPSHRRRRRVGHAETPLRWVAVRLSFDLLPKDWSGFALISVSGLRLDGSMVLWGLDSHQHGVLRLPGYQAGEELV